MIKLSVAFLLLSTALASAQQNVDVVNPLGYPHNAFPITGNASGATEVVVATLAASSDRITYICGFSVSAAGMGAIGPIVLDGIVGGPMVFQLAATTNGTMMSQSFLPCLPAATSGMAITITTNGNTKADAVGVNSWGWQR